MIGRFLRWLVGVTDPTEAQIIDAMWKIARPASTREIQEQLEEKVGSVLYGDLYLILLKLRNRGVVSQMIRTSSNPEKKEMIWSILK